MNQYLTELWEIEIGQDVGEPMYTGYVYRDGEKLYYDDYAEVVDVGKNYTYTEMEKFFSYGFFSWGDEKDGYLFGNMRRGQMFFKLKSVPEEGVDLEFEMLSWLPVSPDEFTVKNRSGEILYSNVFTGSIQETVTVHIPVEDFTENGLVVLDFYFPNAVLNKDHRQMNFGFYSFRIKD